LTHLDKIPTLDRDGFLLTAAVLSAAQIEEINLSLNALQISQLGARNLLQHSWCQELAQIIIRHPLIASNLREEMQATQCTYFEKSQDQNWLVALHQDLAVPVAERFDHCEYRAWTEKKACYSCNRQCNY